jgi:hypothetical protein
MVTKVQAAEKNMNPEAQAEVKEVEMFEFNGVKNKWLCCAVRCADHLLKDTKVNKEFLKVLVDTLVAKFRQNEDLMGKLIDTGDQKIVFKKKSHVLGKVNTLGHVLMVVRKELLKPVDTTIPCTAQPKEWGKDAGCYNGTYWVIDYTSGQLRPLRKCYRCKGTGRMTTENKVREQDGKTVWSDKERHDRYTGTHEEKPEGTPMTKEEVEKEIDDVLDGPISVA